MSSLPVPYGTAYSGTGKKDGNDATGNDEADLGAGEAVVLTYVALAEHLIDRIDIAAGGAAESR